MITFDSSNFSPILTPRAEILRIREEYFKNKPDAFKGNSRARSNYLAQLSKIKPEFTNFQKRYLLGLNLGDTSIDRNNNARTARVKLQQRADRLLWMEHIRKIFLEYMPSNLPFKAPSAKRPTMLELQTLKCREFFDFFDQRFYLNPGGIKGISQQVVDELCPVSVAAWLCGDGSKADHTKNGGKGITFHSQGFTQAENAALAAGLGKLGIKAQAKQDGAQYNQWRVDISGQSYDEFVRTVGPFVHPDFHHRIPTGRESTSRFGNMTAPLRIQYLGSKLNNLEWLIENFLKSRHQLKNSKIFRSLVEDIVCTPAKAGELEQNF